MLPGSTVKRFNLQIIFRRLLRMHPIRSVKRPIIDSQPRPVSTRCSASSFPCSRPIFEEVRYRGPHSRRRANSIWRHVRLASELIFPNKRKIIVQSDSLLRFSTKFLFQISHSILHRSISGPNLALSETLSDLSDWIDHDRLDSALGTVHHDSTRSSPAAKCARIRTTIVHSLSRILSSA